MPLFDYTAKNRQGDTISKTIESVNIESAKRELRLTGLIVSEIEEKIESKESGYLSKLKDRLPITTKDRVFFCRQLALMLRSGMSLVNALDLMSEDFPKKKFRDVLQQTTSKLREGLSFYQCLQLNTRTFTPLLVQIIEAAEESGELSHSLLAVSDQIKFRSQMRQKAITACIYPGIVLFLALGIGAFMVFKIIPKFDEFLSKKDIPLPYSTQLVINISRFAQNYWIHSLILFSLMGTVFLFLYRTKPGRRFIEKVALTIPIFGKLFKNSVMANFSSSTSLLLRSGLGLVESLNLNSRMMPLLIYKELFTQASSKIMTGKTLKDSLKTSIIPPTVINVISIGEETGALHDVLDELGDFYGDEVESSVDLIVSSIEPFLLVVVGSIVALVYFALFQAIIRLMGT